MKFTVNMFSIFDAMPDALVVINPQGEIVFFNVQAEKLFGYSREELLSGNLEILMPERFRYHHVTLRFRYFEHPHVRPPLGEGLEIYGLKKDGTEFPVEISLSPLDMGTELFSLAAVRDITQRKKAEDKIKEVLEAIPDALVATNQEGIIILINTQAEKLFGYSRIELLGASIEKLMPERYRQAHPGQRTEYFHNPRIRPIDAGLELYGLKKEGDEFPIEVSLSPLESEEGRWVLTTIRDITERKEFEQNLHEQNIVLQNMMEKLRQQTAECLQVEKELAEYRLAEQKTRVQVAEEYQQRQEEFINTICHEIRNPLNVIYGEVDLLKEKINSFESLFRMKTASSSEWVNSTLAELIEKCREDMDAIEECARQQKIIVDDVLDFSKLENNKMELNPVIFNLQKVMHSILKMFIPQLRRKNISWEMNMPENKVWLKADVYRLRQIITNLISNAIKFTHVGAVSIIVNLQPLSNNQIMLCISIKDTGIGMTDEEKTHLFQRFSQASRQTVIEYGGSGLGLLISKKLIKKMDGKIQVESQKGKGSCFTFTVKCSGLKPEEQLELNKEKFEFVTQAHKKYSYLESDDSSYSSKNINILIVEDNKMNQKLLEAYLSKQGYYHQVANNGAEAVELFEKFEFDLILMDIEMPTMGGLEATRRIRLKEQDLSRRIPIIGLSGNAHKEQVLLAIKSGMSDYLTKPYHKEELYKLIKKHTASAASVEEKVVSSSVALVENLSQSASEAVPSPWIFFVPQILKLPSYHFFSLLHDNNYLIEHRHELTQIQQEYDRRYGLVSR